MDHSTFSQPSDIPPQAATYVHLQPLNFPPAHRTGYREAAGSSGLSPAEVPAVDDGVESNSVFNPRGFDSFPASYSGPPSGTVVRLANASAIPRAFRGIAPPPAHEPHQSQQQQQQQQQQQSGRKRLSPQRQAHNSQRLSPGMASTNPALPPLVQFGIPPHGPAENQAVNEAEAARGADLVRMGSASGSTSSRPARTGQLPVKIVENPPDLDRWRQRLFDLDEPVILTKEEYDMYFPWVDNIYSLRSNQPYKRKNLVTRYFDCRMTGRRSGKPTSVNPNRKKRNRTARPLGLCEVKIKITEYPKGSAAELRQAVDGFGLGRMKLEEELVRIRDGPFWVIERINGNRANGSGDSRVVTHKHSLQTSDAAKKSTAMRRLAEREKEAKRNQKPSPWRPKGEAAATAKSHAKNAAIKFYSACFCPFSQRVWIALEAKGLEYQYCETYPLCKPKPTPLLEANPRGLVPAICQEGWACAESSVILEYLEDSNGTVLLHPTVPKLKANCRLWIDFINTRIVPSFYTVLVAAEEEARKHGVEKLQGHLSDLVQAAGEEGPYFLGASMCLVDVHLAPFALRLSRLAPFWDLPPPTPSPRWTQWLNALEQNPYIRSTMSPDTLYTQSMDDLIKGLQGISD